MATPNDSSTHDAPPHQVLLRACQAAGEEGRAAALQQAMQRRGLVSLAVPRATAVCARTGAQLAYGNGRSEPTPIGGTGINDPPPDLGASRGSSSDLADLAAELCARVAAGSGYRTQYHALPFDFVQRCSLQQQARHARPPLRCLGLQPGCVGCSVDASACS